MIFSPTKPLKRILKSKKTWSCEVFLPYISPFCSSHRRRVKTSASLLDIYHLIRRTLLIIIPDERNITPPLWNKNHQLHTPKPPKTKISREPIGHPNQQKKEKTHIPKIPRRKPTSLTDSQLVVSVCKCAKAVAVVTLPVNSLFFQQDLASCKLSAGSSRFFDL